jgi:hypothetical protein
MIFIIIIFFFFFLFIKKKNIKCPFKPSTVFLNNLFKNKIDWIYYFSSFYIFLNISSNPVLTIVIRKNLMKLLSPKKIPSIPGKVTP